MAHATARIHVLMVVRKMEHASVPISAPMDVMKMEIVHAKITVTSATALVKLAVWMFARMDVSHPVHVYVPQNAQMDAMQTAVNAAIQSV